MRSVSSSFFFFQAEDGIRDKLVTGVQTCALPISRRRGRRKERGSGWRRSMASSSKAAGTWPSIASPAAARALRFIFRVIARSWRARSEERRVGKEWRWWGASEDEKRVGRYGGGGG